MNTLIVYFSKFGNTQKIAAAIAKTLESEGSVRVISADRLTASDLNQVKYKLIALTILLILLTACGSAEPTALLIPPTAIPNPTPTPQIVYVTATPRVVEVTATPEPIALPPTPTSEPAGSGISFMDSGQHLGSAQSWAVALGDLDGDGDLDALVANAAQGGANNTVWMNDGQGVFTLNEQTPGYGQDVALGDLDGDGDLDAVVTNWWGEEHSAVWLNDGSGNFSDSGQNLGFAFQPALGDLDGDGDLDIFMAQLEANTVWLNDGSSDFTDTGQRLGTGITAAVALDDLDGDGDLDALAGGWDEAAKVWLNDGVGTFAEHDQSLSPASVHIHDLALGDVDGDGDPDAFMAVASGDPNQVWLNDGTGAFSDSGQQLRSSLAHGVSLGDLDGDGDLDALTAHGDPWRGSSGGTIWLNDGTGRFDKSDLNLGNLYSSYTALGDLDGDGDLDAFIAHGETGQENGGELPNKVWLNETIPSAVIVLQGSSPTLDGTLSPGEWDNATVETFADGSELLLMHADGYLYLGIRVNIPGMIVGNIFVNRGDEITILHSSAALGTAAYQKGEDNWQQIQNFTWQCRDTSDSDAAKAERDAFLQQEGWVAANSRMGTPEELEYRIEMAEDTLRLAMNFIRASNQNKKIPWPPDLEDDCIKPTPGGLPPEMQFSPELWGMISKESR